MLSIIQKKGVPNPLCGRLFAYARILPGPSPKGAFPWDDLVQNGLLVVTGEFKNMSTLGDFLRREIGRGNSDSIEGLIAKLRDMGEEIPEDLSPEDMRQKLEGMTNMEIIPVPARIVSFESEEALLQMDADIFYLGEFVGIQHAHLAVTSFPILYQAIYREQQSCFVQSEIDQVLEQVMSTQVDLGDPVILDLQGNLQQFKGDLLELLMGTVVPNLVYNLDNLNEFGLSMQNFRIFMEGYRLPADLDALEGALRKLPRDEAYQNRHVELLCRKIAALHQEEFEKLPSIQLELSKYH